MRKIDVTDIETGDYLYDPSKGQQRPETLSDVLKSLRTQLKKFSNRFDALEKLLNIKLVYHDATPATISYEKEAQDEKHT